MEELLKMLQAGGGEGEGAEMSDMEIQAKMEVLKELLELAQASSGKHVMDGMEGMQQLTVAAPDKEGLMEGMEKAEEIVEEVPMDDDMEYEGDEEMPMSEEEDEKYKKKY